MFPIVLIAGKQSAPCQAVFQQDSQNTIRVNLTIIGEVPRDNQVIEIDAFGPIVLQDAAQRLSGRHAVQVCVEISKQVQVRELENTNRHQALLT